MSIPLSSPKPLDPLDLFALEKAHWGETSPSTVLDVRRYREAIAAGLPIPTFKALNRRGEPVGRPRVVTSAMVQEIIESPLPAEQLEKLLQVDALIIRDLRARLLVIHFFEGARRVDRPYDNNTH